MFALVKKNIPTPMIIGHEFVGEVAGYGDNVKDFAIGERVSGEGHICLWPMQKLPGRTHREHDSSGM